MDALGLSFLLLRRDQTLENATIFPYRDTKEKLRNLVFTDKLARERIRAINRRRGVISARRRYFFTE